MTGFGRAEGVIGDSQLTVEIKSVNHRYLETRFRMPGFLGQFEIAFGQLLRSRFSRGSFDISIRHKLIQSTEATGLTGTRFVVDSKAADSLIAGYLSLQKQHSSLPATPPAELLVGSGKVFVPCEDISGVEEAFEQIKDVFSKAVDQLEQARKNEGSKLHEILTLGITELGDLSDKLEKAAEEQNPKIREKLEKRIKEWDISSPVDNQRLEWEIAFYADRADFKEELDRLRLLVAEFTQKLKEPERVGRKLDFLTQELHRELNTTGAKAALFEITQLVVHAKSIIEKLRQQVQNVE